MGLVDLDAAEIPLVWCMEQRQILIENIRVFLLKNFPIFRIDFVSVRIILAVLRHLVDKRQRQRLDFPG